MSIYTKESFKKEWESDDCAITFEDIADCAIAWKITNRPRTCKIDHVRYWVLKAAETADVEEYRPEEFSE